MRRQTIPVWSLLFVLVLLGAGGLHAQAMPKFISVEPDTGKAGDQLTASGENLEKTNVAEVYLTDGKNDMKVEVVEQTATAIKFRVPAKVKPGRLALMILTTGAAPKLLEQPVKVTIE